LMSNVDSVLPIVHKPTLSTIIGQSNLIGSHLQVYECSSFFAPVIRACDSFQAQSAGCAKIPNTFSSIHQRRLTHNSEGP
jgi:hypothetical protein